MCFAPRCSLSNARDISMMRHERSLRLSRPVAGVRQTGDIAAGQRRRSAASWGHAHADPPPRGPTAHATRSSPSAKLVGLLREKIEVGVAGQFGGAQTADEIVAIFIEENDIRMT